MGGKVLQLESERLLELGEARGKLLERQKVKRKEKLRVRPLAKRG